MPIPIEMPRLSDTMEEGTLVKWQVKVGDKVESGDHLADVETDKATMELQAFDDGTVARIDVEEGQTVPVGQVILMLAGEGESVEEAAGAADEGTEAKAASNDEDEAKAEDKQEAEASEEEKAERRESGKKQAVAKKREAGGEEEEADEGGGVAVAEEGEEAEQEEKAEKAARRKTGRLRISPVARKIAEEHDLDPSDLTGSGPDGRIIKRDVLEAIESGKTKPAKKKAEPDKAPAAAPVTAATLEDKTIQLSSMRKTIAKRLVESKTTIPHFQATMRVDMDPLMELRATLNEQLESQGIKLSVNDFIARAAALACVQHPQANSSWTGEAIRQHGTVNLGVAVALPAERGGGLVVPVIRDAQNKGLRQLSEETRRLAKKARESGLSPEEMADGTFTMSNLGMYGVDQFNAIINPPQAAILAVGAALEQPVVRDGELTVGHVMSAVLSADHRVLDGAVAAEYLQTFKQLLENPAALLV